MMAEVTLWLSALSFTCTHALCSRATTAALPPPATAAPSLVDAVHASRRACTRATQRVRAARMPVARARERRPVGATATMGARRSRRKRRTVVMALPCRCCAKAVASSMRASIRCCAALEEVTTGRATVMAMLCVSAVAMAGCPVSSTTCKQAEMD